MQVFGANDHESARRIFVEVWVVRPVLFSHALSLTGAVYHDSKGVLQRELSVVWHEYQTRVYPFGWLTAAGVLCLTRVQQTDRA
ncbi:hypothetical protein At1D1108_26710 [Agrobacterium tumefaciens]|nr:hypothetical protein At1D1108_26710 [Agrobacterium tumefaciens]